MKVAVFFVVVLVILLILMGIFLFLFKLSKLPPSWPYIFNLKNLGPKSQKVQVLVNGGIYKSYEIASGAEVRVLVGDNITNPRTNKPLQHLEVFNVAFYLFQDGNIQYDSPNSFRAPSFSSGSCTKNCHATSKREGNRTLYFFQNKGYYTIFMQ